MLEIADGRFAQDRRSALAARLGDPPVVAADEIASVPVTVTREYIERLRDLSRVLDIGLRAIVAHYFDDPRISAIYGLPEALVEMLRHIADKPYRIGFYRPDFVYDLEGQPRICEIGARYPLNGWMLSQYGAEVYAPSVAWMESAAPVAQRYFLDELCAQYRPGDTVAMVHAREAGTEIFLLGKALQERGVTFVQAHPALLYMKEGHLCIGDVVVNACILEMDRSELPLIPGDVVQHLIESGAYFNDIRTLILVHDKRTLAVLWDEAIMRDLLSAEDRAILRSFLIPSFAIGDASGCEALLARDEDMIVKRSSGGRGVDALVRSACGEAGWRARISAEWAQDMYQLYLPQREFRAPGEGRPVHLVGMQLCRDGTSYGAGVFRGSDEKIINMHGRRGHIYIPLVAS
jgi:hypothetical protein